MKTLQVLLTFLIVPIWFLIAIPSFLVMFIYKGTDRFFRWASALMLTVCVGERASELIEKLKIYETRSNN